MNGCALTCAIWAYKPGYLTFGDREGNVVNGGKATVTFCQMFHFEQQLGVSSARMVARVQGILGLEIRMLVLCNGMPRSASTWSYNVVMKLLRECSPSENVFGGYDENVTQFLKSAPAGVEHIVLKCHTLDAAGKALASTGAARVVYTWRDVADAAISFMRMFGYEFDHAFSVMSTSLELYEFHRKTRNAVLLTYDEITTDPVAAIERIGEYLGLSTPSKVLDRIAAATSFQRMRDKVTELERTQAEGRLVQHENTTYDPDTLLNLHHIRNGGSGFGRQALAPEQLSRINALSSQYGLAD